MRMKVRPRFCQTVTTATATSAQSRVLSRTAGSWSSARATAAGRPAGSAACRRSATPPRPTWRPSTRRTCGRRRCPRSRWCASTASPSPSAMPTGTVSTRTSSVTLKLSRKSRDVEHVAVLVEADVRARQPRERRRAVEAQRSCARTVEDEHAEDDAATGAPAGSRGPALARRGGAGAGAGGERPRRRARPRGRLSCVRPGRRSRRRTRAARAGRSSRRTGSPSAGRRVVRVLADDHELPVVEPAHDVALVAERLDDGDRRAASPPSARSAGARGARRSRPSSSPRRSTAARERGRERDARRRGAHGDARRRRATTSPVTVFIGGLPMKRATKRLAGRVVDVLGRPDLLQRAVGRGPRCDGPSSSPRPGRG